MSRPLQRLRLLHQVRWLARLLGRQQARGDFDGHLLRRQQRAQDKATQAGCHVADVADATFEGMEQGRQEADDAR